MITFCATEEWICQFGCARAPFVQRRLTAEASSQLHALGDRAHEEMVGTRVPSARGGIFQIAAGDFAREVIWVE